MYELLNCFCGLVDRRKVFSLISSQYHCQRSSPSRIPYMLRPRFEPIQDLSSGLVIHDKHPDEHNDRLCHYRFMIYLDRCGGSCNDT